LSATDVESEIRELQRLVAYHSERYHVHDDPEIADDEYDELFRRLQALEAEHP
jgi:DNA ligase (NAD+)